MTIASIVKCLPGDHKVPVSHPPTPDSTKGADYKKDETLFSYYLYQRDSISRDAGMRKYEVHIWQLVFGHLGSTP